MTFDRSTSGKRHKLRMMHHIFLLLCTVLLAATANSMDSSLCNMCNEEKPKCCTIAEKLVCVKKDTRCAKNWPYGVCDIKHCPKLTADVSLCNVTKYKYFYCPLGQCGTGNKCADNTPMAWSYVHPTTHNNLYWYYFTYLCFFASLALLYYQRNMVPMRYKSIPLLSVSIINLIVYHWYHGNQKQEDACFPHILTAVGHSSHILLTICQILDYYMRWRNEQHLNQLLKNADNVLSNRVNIPLALSPSSYRWISIFCSSWTYAIMVVLLNYIFFAYFLITRFNIEPFNEKGLCLLQDDIIITITTFSLTLIGVVIGLVVLLSEALSPFCIKFELWMYCSLMMVTMILNAVISGFYISIRKHLFFISDSMWFWFGYSQIDLFNIIYCLGSTMIPLLYNLYIHERRSFADENIKKIITDMLPGDNQYRLLSQYAVDEYSTDVLLLWRLLTGLKSYVSSNDIRQNQVATILYSLFFERNSLDTMQRLNIAHNNPIANAQALLNVNVINNLIAQIRVTLAPMYARMSHDDFYKLYL
jgi:hypothetical protein